MNKEDAKRIADRMTYSEAIMNCFYAKGIRYRKATKIKLNELLEIANRLDKQEKPGELKYVGYSSHDDESRYQCPVCKEGYGGRRMKIVIDIPEEQYEIIKELVRKQNSVCPEADSAEKIILSGTPLPKGHGDLIDVIKLKAKMFDLPQQPEGNYWDGVDAVGELIDNTQTIIPADKESMAISALSVEQTAIKNFGVMECPKCGTLFYEVPTIETVLEDIKDEIQGLIDFEESCCVDTTLGYQCLGIIDKYISRKENQNE